MVDVRNGKFEVFRFLMDIHAYINIRNTKINTDFQLNTELNSVNIMQIVWGKEMSVNLTDTHDFILYMFQLKLAICMQGKLLSKELLLSKTPVSMVTLHWSWLHTMANKNYFFTSQYSYNIHSSKYISAVHFVSVSDNVDIIKLLLDKEMSVNLTQRTLHRYTFQLEMAIWKQRKLPSKDLLL
jgi:hypothetical protein